MLYGVVINHPLKMISSLMLMTDKHSVATKGIKENDPLAPRNSISPNRSDKTVTPEIINTPITAPSRYDFIHPAEVNPSEEIFRFSPYFA